ncbi:hypothetical protein RCJ22_01945, partial [Vibrio sp. FNV 38]|nr:hypothetical protein [Vibrio sp. FNV 38]
MFQAVRFIILPGTDTGPFSFFSPRTSPGPHRGSIPPCSCSLPRYLTDSDAQAQRERQFLVSVDRVPDPFRITAVF